MSSRRTNRSVDDLVVTSPGTQVQRLRRQRSKSPESRDDDSLPRRSSPVRRSASMPKRETVRPEHVARSPGNRSKHRASRKRLKAKRQLNEIVNRNRQKVRGRTRTNSNASNSSHGSERSRGNSVGSTKSEPSTPKKRQKRFTRKAKGSGMILAKAKHAFFRTPNKASAPDSFSMKKKKPKPRKTPFGTSKHMLDFSHPSFNEHSFAEIQERRKAFAMPKPRSTKSKKLHQFIRKNIAKNRVMSRPLQPSKMDKEMQDKLIWAKQEPPIAASSPSTSSVKVGTVESNSPGTSVEWLKDMKENGSLEQLCCHNERILDLLAMHGVYRLSDLSELVEEDLNGIQADIGNEVILQRIRQYMAAHPFIHDMIRERMSDDRPPPPLMTTLSRGEHKRGPSRGTLVRPLSGQSTQKHDEDVDEPPMSVEGSQEGVPESDSGDQEGEGHVDIAPTNYEDALHDALGYMKYFLAYASIFPFHQFRSARSPRAKWFAFCTHLFYSFVVLVCTIFRLFKNSHTWPEEDDVVFQVLAGVGESGLTVAAQACVVIAWFVMQLNMYQNALISHQRFGVVSTSSMNITPAVARQRIKIFLRNSSWFHAENRKWHAFVAFCFIGPSLLSFNLPRLAAVVSGDTPTLTDPLDARLYDRFGNWYMLLLSLTDPFVYMSPILSICLFSMLFHMYIAQTSMLLTIMHNEAKDTPLQSSPTAAYPSDDDLVPSASHSKLSQLAVDTNSTEVPFDRFLVRDASKSMLMQDMTSTSPYSERRKLFASNGSSSAHASARSLDLVRINQVSAMVDQIMEEEKRPDAPSRQRKRDREKAKRATSPQSTPSHTNACLSRETTTPSHTAGRTPRETTPSHTAGRAPRETTPSHTAGRTPRETTPSHTAGRAPRETTPSHTAGRAPWETTPSHVRERRETAPSYISGRAPRETMSSHTRGRGETTPSRTSGPAPRETAPLHTSEHVTPGYTQVMMPQNDDDVEEDGREPSVMQLKNVPRSNQSSRRNSGNHSRRNSGSRRHAKGNGGKRSMLNKASLEALDPKGSVPHTRNSSETTNSLRDIRDAYIQHPLSTKSAAVFGNDNSRDSSPDPVPLTPLRDDSTPEPAPTPPRDAGLSGPFQYHYKPDHDSLLGNMSAKHASQGELSRRLSRTGNTAPLIAEPVSNGVVKPEHMQWLNRLTALKMNRHFLEQTTGVIRTGFPFFAIPFIIATIASASALWWSHGGYGLLNLSNVCISSAIFGMLYAAMGHSARRNRYLATKLKVLQPDGLERNDAVLSHRVPVHASTPDAQYSVFGDLLGYGRGPEAADTYADVLTNGYQLTATEERASDSSSASVQSALGPALEDNIFEPTTLVSRRRSHSRGSNSVDLFALFYYGVKRPRQEQLAHVVRAVEGEVSATHSSSKTGRYPEQRHSSMAAQYVAAMEGRGLLLPRDAEEDDTRRYNFLGDISLKLSDVCLTYGHTLRNTAVIATLLSLLLSFRIYTQYHKCVDIDANSIQGDRCTSIWNTVRAVEAASASWVAMAWPCAMAYLTLGPFRLPRRMSYTLVSATCCSVGLFFMFATSGDSWEAQIIVRVLFVAHTAVVGAMVSRIAGAVYQYAWTLSAALLVVAVILQEHVLTRRFETRDDPDDRLVLVFLFQPVMDFVFDVLMRHSVRSIRRFALRYGYPTDYPYSFFVAMRMVQSLVGRMYLIGVGELSTQVVVLFLFAFVRVGSQINKPFLIYVFNRFARRGVARSYQRSEAYRASALTAHQLYFMLTTEIVSIFLGFGLFIGIRGYYGLDLPGAGYLLGALIAHLALQLAADVMLIKVLESYVDMQLISLWHANMVNYAKHVVLWGVPICAMFQQLFIRIAIAGADDWS